MESSSDGSECAHRLNIVAYTFATAAEDTFVHIANNGSRYFAFARREFATVERHFADVEAQGQGLKFTVAAFGASEAVVGVVGQNEFGYYFAGIHYAQGTGFYDHSFGATGSAGGGQILSSHYFDCADAARSGIVLNASTLQVDIAKGGDVNADFAGGFEDRTSFGHGNVVTVYLEGNLFFFHNVLF